MKVGLVLFRISSLYGQRDFSVCVNKSVNEFNRTTMVYAISDLYTDLDYYNRANTQEL